MARLAPPKIGPDDVKSYDELANRGKRAQPGDVAPDPDDLNSLVGQLFHNPPLARDVGQLIRGLAGRNVLGPALRELVVLRTSATVRAGYEWVTHVGAARRAGLTDDQLAALRRRTDGSEFDPLQRAALQAVDATLAAQSIPQAAQEKLLAAVGASGLVELILLCSAYRMIASFVAALDIPLPAGAADPF